MPSNFSILLFLAIVAFALNLGCGMFANNSSLDVHACSTPLDDIFTRGYSSIYSQLFILLGALGLVGVSGLLLGGTFTFPNPYAIFAAITLSVLLMGVIPQSGFGLLGFPAVYTTFFNGIFSLAWLFASYNAFKGGEV